MNSLGNRRKSQMERVFRPLLQPALAPIRVLALLLFGALLVTLIESGYGPAAAQDLDADYWVYLPLIEGGGGGTLPPPVPVGGRLFIDTEYKTSSASIQVDAQGGMHLAYTYYEAANDGKPTYGVYLTCTADCEQDANWNGVGLGELVNEIQLKLTPAEQPRVIFRASSQARPNGHDYYYAACDQNCTDPAQWGVLYLASSSGIGVIDLLREDSLPQRYFALDPQGRPRFVYNDGVTNHYGTFYAFCDSDCLDIANWYETQINQVSTDPGPYRDENFYYPTLTFTPQGQPRIATEGFSFQDEAFLYYLACDTGCGDISNWQSVPLMERGSGPNVSYDISTDATGRPRIIYYQGALLGSQGDRLFYLWCNGGCANGNNWDHSELGLAQSNGRGPDLELDSTGRPRIAYAMYDGGGLGYSWCDSNCESAGAPWQHRVVESASALEAEWPVAYPPHCDGGLWNGLAPALALDQGGNPYIAYDTTYHARCIYIPETGVWEPTTIFHLIWRAVRLNYFPQP